MVEYGIYIKKKRMDSFPLGKYFKFSKLPQRIYKKKRFKLKKKLYLANPYGFSTQTKKLLYEFINIFNDLNIEVYEPFERTKHIMQKKSEWAYDLAKSNFKDLKKNTNCPNEQVVALLSVIASNYAITTEKKEN